MTEQDDAGSLRRRLRRQRNLYLVILSVLVVVAGVNAATGNLAMASLYSAPVAVALVIVIALTLTDRRRP